MDERRKFGEYLKERARIRGLKNSEVAKALKVSSPYVSQIYGGVSVPGSEQFETLMKFLNLDINEEELLTELYVRIKTGLSELHFNQHRTIHVERGNVEQTPLEKVLLSKFRQLTRLQRFEFLYEVAENTGDNFEGILLHMFRQISPDKQADSIFSLDQHIMNNIDRQHKLVDASED